MATDNTNPTSTPTAVVTLTSPKVAAPAKKSRRRPLKKAVAKKTNRATKNVVVKTAQKTASKPTVKAAPSKAAKKARPRPQENPIAEHKFKKPKLVRDSFTFPKDEYQAIAELKHKALNLKHSSKKSEILRAGLKLLSGLNDKAFLAALAKVPALKTGRPVKS